MLAAVAAGGFTLAQRKRLAAEAFAHTASYDVAVASWMGNVLTDTSDGTGFPAFDGRDLAAHGGAALRREPAPAGRALRATGAGGLADAEQLHGKEMSYNNYVDTDAARRAAYDFDEPAVAIIKHANPCGIAVGADVAEAHRKAHACDPVSAFGGVIAVNRPVSTQMAEQVAEIFTEVIVAPGVRGRRGRGPARRKKNIRILRCALDEHPDPVEFRGDLRRRAHAARRPRRRARRRPGDLDAGHRRRPRADDVLADLAFAWRACRSVKSNAILLAHDGASVGVGMGQVNRVDSCAARGVAGRGAGRRLGRGLRRVLPVRGRPAGPDRRRRPRDRAARRVDARRADGQGRQDAGVTMYFTGTRHFFH